MIKLEARPVVSARSLLDSFLHSHVFLCTYAANSCTAPQFIKELDDHMAKLGLSLPKMTAYSVFKTWLAVF